MHPDYGKQIGQAFAAVCQLHHDVSRLLKDITARLGSGRTTATIISKDITGSLNWPSYWMPYAVSMSSAGGELPANVAEIVMVYFWSDDPKPQEPHLVLAKFSYAVAEDGSTSPDFWDAWNACFEWDQPFPAGVVSHFSPNDGRVETVTVTAVPLFDITSVDGVLKHMQAVRERAAQG